MPCSGDLRFLPRVDLLLGLFDVGGRKYVVHVRHAHQPRSLLHSISKTAQKEGHTFAHDRVYPGIPHTFHLIRGNKVPAHSRQSSGTLSLYPKRKLITNAAEVTDYYHALNI